MRRIVVFIPNTGMSYHREFVESYIHAKNWLFAHADLIPFEFALVEYFCHTFPIDANRNECVAFALQNNLDLTIWLDTDQEFPRETLLKLIRHDLPIVAGVYHAKTPPFHPIVFRESPKSDDFNLFDSIVDFPEKELFTADMIGMGCVAIKREVLEKLEKPYFKYREQPKQLAGDPYVAFKREWGVADISEDVWFWKQVKERTDYEIWIDPTIDCAHIGRYKVNRSVWKNYFEQQKEDYRATFGETELQKRLAQLCRPEKTKSAS